MNNYDNDFEIEEFEEEEEEEKKVNLSCNCGRCLECYGMSNQDFM